MNIDIKSIKDLGELEFKYLKDLSKLKEKTDTEKAEADKNFIVNPKLENSGSESNIRALCDIGYSATRIKLVEVIEDVNVGIFITLDYASNEIYEIEDKELIKMSQDDNIVIIKDGYNTFSFIDKDFFNDEEYAYKLCAKVEELKKENKIYRYFKVKYDEDDKQYGDYNYDYKVITKEFAEQSVYISIAETEKEKREEEEKQKEQEQAEEKTKETKRADYENVGIYKAESDVDDGNGNMTNKGIVVENNIINKNAWIKWKYIFEKPVNTFLTFDEVKNLDDSEQNRLLELFLEKKVSFDYSYQEKDIAKISFDGNRVKIDDVSVSKSKVLFILGKIRYSPTEKLKIDLYDKLSGMKVDVLNLKNIEFNLKGINSSSSDKNINENSLEIPITISLLDENFFKLTMFDKTIPMTWARITHFFFETEHTDNYGEKINKIRRTPDNYFDLIKFQELVKEMSMDKTFIFENLNKIKLFNAI